MATTDRKPTLVMGAQGSVGQYVLAELLDRQLPVRASTRRPQPGQFPAGVDVVTADLTDAASLVPAFDGVARVFLYANHDGVTGVIDSARAAGVERIVLMSSGSVLHPTSRGNAITEEHRAVEAQLADAEDLTVVPIRPLVLASNALGRAYPVRATGRLPLYQPDAATAPIHERDIAAVAVAALLGDDDTTDMLTGPVRISQRAQVATIAAATGQPIAVDEIDRGTALAQFSRFMPVTEAEAVLQFLDDAAVGNSPATTAVERILGRPALGFDAWAIDHAGDFRSA